MENKTGTAQSHTYLPEKKSDLWDTYSQVNLNKNSNYGDIYYKNTPELVQIVLALVPLIEAWALRHFHKPPNLFLFLFLFHTVKAKKKAIF